MPRNRHLERESLMSSLIVTRQRVKQNVHINLVKIDFNHSSDIILKNKF